MAAAPCIKNPKRTSHILFSKISVGTESEPEPAAFPMSLT